MLRLSKENFNILPQVGHPLMLLGARDLTQIENAIAMRKRTGKLGEEAEEN